MNASDRNTSDYAHRGQRLTKFLPDGMIAHVGEQLSITFDGPGAWIMPATVREIVHGIHGETIVTLEPGAAVKHPERWYIVDPVAQLHELAAVATTPQQQFDLFAL